MIINIEREPGLSLYYLGSVIIAILSKKNNILLDELYIAVQEKSNQNIHIDFLYYALDWLYIQSLIEVKEGKVIYAD
ncbi:ABC-three component system middle component 6 [Faecalicatena contorta]|uniref:DUF4364 family protein n=1 Tax=Faecalicatena contorta TaxID=39482 RepID=A0A315ZS31_9FIRM|nr:ABC-three component system middle component 6 [Faecalicatena contorta]PWJ48099.1 hypothetical protein A8805_11475 [Faecalicatena contorta]SUQ15626.1 hypothetical protein SAMN05216529_11475 [Faecalicatena contorta]